MRDLFLYNADVRPVVDRLKAFLIGVTLIWLISCAGLNASLNFNPLFDQYDTAMLERLKADDKLAEVAAQQSGGRPTYCDSRYYRAVAGGAPGATRICLIYLLYYVFSTHFWMLSSSGCK